MCCGKITYIEARYNSSVARTAEDPANDEAKTANQRIEIGQGEEHFSCSGEEKGRDHELNDVFIKSAIETKGSDVQDRNELKIWKVQFYYILYFSVNRRQAGMLALIRFDANIHR
ncbi:hypothetical protein AVEN_218371-1 [Araneus ventricosus]|uniref:Uncharacterized protein n=1 Tax=Araneus ventricosus TaxID=182803 RepID=A0A4Y2PRT7_ARAVE|nr:hypothetical protein AVEN_218371-1 [Araneus ventricosus]